ncbi:MAG TPA: hypothetical protein VMO88_14340 [Acidimicrobiales bacterium]|nr:hypothetical protein [Acidimicrobiales bacterium]
MQIIESTPFGVRSAVLTVARPDTGVRFVIFPMMHLGSVEYFREVDGRLRDCDRILAEGVTGRRVSVMTASYRLVARIKRLDLVEQGKALDLRAYGDRVTNVDVSAPEFGRSWRRVPRAWRLLLYGVVPVFALWMLLAGSRRLLARDAEIGDLPTRDEALMGDEYDRLSAGLLGDRDRKLCAAIAELVATGSASPVTVGIVWGAAHMRAVIALLVGRLGYHVVGAEWVTVFVP